MASQRWKLHLSVVVSVVAAMTLALVPAIADPLPGTDEYADVAFLARNDVPFDAQTAAAVAAQLGAPIFITTPNVLTAPAQGGIAAANPDVLIIAGGTAAITDAVAIQAAQACDPDCTIDRRFGPGRDETAAALAGVAADYGFDRPVLQGSKQVVGDVNVGGTVNTDAITVQDTGLVAGLNADRVDGMHAEAFALSNQACPAGQVQSGVAPDGTPTCVNDAGGANSIVGKGGQLGYAWANDPTDPQYTPSAIYSFNSSGGAIVARRSGVGDYSMQFVGLNLNQGHIQVTRYTGNGYCNTNGWAGDTVLIGCYDETGAPEDTAYDIMFVN